MQRAMRVHVWLNWVRMLSRLHASLSANKSNDFTTIGP